MLLPPLLLVDDSYTDIEAFTAMVRRIGLAHAVRPSGSLREAREYLTACETTRLPVAVILGGAVRDGQAHELVDWMAGQAIAIAGLPTLRLEKPIEMHPLIAALKSLGLPEKVKLDAMTLTVRVELWPRGTLAE